MSSSDPGFKRFCKVSLNMESLSVRRVHVNGFCGGMLNTISIWRFSTLKTPLDLDVVLIEAIPRRAMGVLHASIFDKGLINNRVSVPRQICAALTVRAYLGRFNVSIAFEFARMAVRSFCILTLPRLKYVGLQSAILSPLISIIWTGLLEDIANKLLKKYSIKP
ncbi:MAG: hypothetical protein ACUVQ5_02345 [Candidatus Methanomethylicaceae archaeon]